MDKTLIVKRVLSLVCDAVNVSFASLRPDVKQMADKDDLFTGHGHLTKVAARHFSLRTLHDIYGFSYSELSQISSLGVRPIMRLVKNVRETVFFDPLSMQIKTEIDKRISEGIL